MRVIVIVKHSNIESIYTNTWVHNTVAYFKTERM